MNLQEEINNLIDEYGREAIIKAFNTWVDKTCGTCIHMTRRPSAYPCRKCAANPGASRYESID